MMALSMFWRRNMNVNVDIDNRPPVWLLMRT